MFNIARVLRQCKDCSIFVAWLFPFVWLVARTMFRGQGNGQVPSSPYTFVNSFMYIFIYKVYTPRLSIHFIRNVFTITLQRRGHGLSNGSGEEESWIERGKRGVAKAREVLRDFSSLILTLELANKTAAFEALALSLSFSSSFLARSSSLFFFPLSLFLVSQVMRCVCRHKWPSANINNRRGKYTVKNVSLSLILFIPFTLSPTFSSSSANTLESFTSLGLAIFLNSLFLNLLIIGFWSSLLSSLCLFFFMFLSSEINNPLPLSFETNIPFFSSLFLLLLSCSFPYGLSCANFTGVSHVQEGARDPERATEKESLMVATRTHDASVMEPLSLDNFIIGHCHRTSYFSLYIYISTSIFVYLYVQSFIRWTRWEREKSIHLRDSIFVYMWNERSRRRERDRERKESLSLSMYWSYPLLRWYDFRSSQPALLFSLLITLF